MPDGLRAGAQRDPGQPVRGRLDDDQLVAVHDQAAGLGQPGGERAHRVRHRVVATDRAVVGVRDRHRAVGQHGDAERVLQPCVGGGAVHETEVEQPAAQRGRDAEISTGSITVAAGLITVNVAERGGLGVDQPQPVAVGGEPGRLREPGLVERSVEKPLVGGAGRDPSRAGKRVERPELVDAGHRDPDPAVVPRDVPRAAQPFGAVALHPLLTVADEGAELAGGEGQPAQPVADGLRDDHVVADLGGHVRRQQTQAVGLAEPLGNTLHQGTVGVDLRDRAVARVGDQQVPVRESHRLGGEPQVTLRCRRRDVRRVPGLQRALRPVLLAEVGEQGVDRVGVALAGVLRDDVPLRVDQHQGRPGACGVGLPGHELGVVEHRVTHVVPLHRCGQGVRIRLVLELRRVHADHHELVGVLLLDLTQLVEHVQAVDAAEGPEVEEHEPAAQVRQGERPVGVQPAAATELGRADARSGGHGSQSDARLKTGLDGPATGQQDVHHDQPQRVPCRTARRTTGPRRRRPPRHGVLHRSARSRRRRPAGRLRHQRAPRQQPPDVLQRAAHPGHDAGDL